MGRCGINIFGIDGILGGLPGVLDAARRADEADVAFLLHTDHVVMGSRTDRYPFGRFPVPPEYPWYEPLTVLAAMAATTARIRLGTAVLIAPLRPATFLAKQAATLDVLSDGRLDLGLGAGWQEEEFTSSSISYEGRFDLLDDTAAACRALWQEGPVALSTPSFSFDELWCHPLPVQAGGPPLWFGGPATGRNARRIATYGVGWLPVSNLSPADLAAAVAGLRQVFADAGRDPAELKVRAGLPLARDDEKRPLLGPTLAQADQFLEAGATEVIVGLGAFVRSAEDLDEALGAIGQA